MQLQLGKITAIHGDCMDYMKSLPDNAYDLAIVDPPYFDGPNKRRYYGSKINKLNIERRDYPIIKDWQVPEQEYFNELKRVSKNQIIWGINYYNIKNLGSGRIIWDKVNGESSFSDCEIAYCSLHGSVRLFRYMWNGMLQGKNIKDGHLMQGNKSLNEVRIHPTQKPINLYKWMLTNYAKPGMKILDTHGGSFSHAIACHNLDFELTIIEKDKDCFDAAVKRLKWHQQQLKLF